MGKENRKLSNRNKEKIKTLADDLIKPAKYVVACPRCGVGSYLTYDYKYVYSRDELEMYQLDGWDSEPIYDKKDGEVLRWIVSIWVCGNHVTACRCNSSRDNLCEHFCGWRGKENELERVYEKDITILTLVQRDVDKLLNHIMLEEEKFEKGKIKVRSTRKIDLYRDLRFDKKTLNRALEILINTKRIKKVEEDYEGKPIIFYVHC